MTNLSRRHLFGLTGGLLASTAIPALVWAASPLNIQAVVSELDERLDAAMERSDFKWSLAEAYDQRVKAGWPGYA